MPPGVRKAVNPKQATPEPSVEAIDTLLKGMDSMRTMLEGLSERVQGIEERQPKYVPMHHEVSPEKALAGTYQPTEAILKRAMKGLTRAGQTVSSSTGPLENPAILSKIPPQYRPVFQSGDTVRVNPEAEIWGGQGRKWSQVLAEVDSVGVGEVMSIQYMTKTWEPKYTVYVQGLTQRGGDGFRESELLPA